MSASAKAPQPSLRIALCAGESSGDVLGSGLIEALAAQFPKAEFAGIGGPEMAAAGMDCWFDASELAVMGLTEVLGDLPRLLTIKSSLLRRVTEWGAAVFIGIDAPDFNLRVEKALRRRGTKTVHYVSPSVWAWRPGRTRKIVAAANHVLCLLPFEPGWYRGYGGSASFVGHPLAEKAKQWPSRDAAREQLGIKGDAPVVAVLPGSRKGELARHAGLFFAAAAKLQGWQPEIRWVSAAPEHLRQPMLDYAQAAGLAPLRLATSGTAALCAADTALLASGTVTLEAALARTPMVVAYRVAGLTAWLVRQLKLMQIDRFALPNIIAQQDLVPEFIQEAATPEALAEGIRSRLNLPGSERHALLSAFTNIHQTLAQNADQRAAAAVSEVLRT